MVGVTGRLSVGADFKLAGAAHGEATGAHESLINYVLGVDAGNGAAGKADLLYQEELIIAASGVQDLDLNGVLKDPLGGNFNATKITLILLKADAANVNNVIVGNAGANGFLGPLGAAAHTIKLEPGCCALFTSIQGYGVVAATGDILHFANSGAGTPVGVEVLLVGRTV